MATRSVSPGAALLRSSRLFSMPAPIPLSSTELAASTPPLGTKYHPTHLSITTTNASRLVGDWGLKRSLPLKRTRRQIVPLVRIHQLDSIERITDYDTAADHTMTLKKFQELNLPINVPMSDKDYARGPKSVFEKDRDMTALDAEQEVALENKRWKFKGPWLAGMTDGEFKKWLAKSVRNRRTEFREYLKVAFAKELTKQQTEEAVKNGQPVPPSIEAEHITEDEYMEHLRELRSDRMILFRHISRFLDLAPLTTDVASINNLRPNVAREFEAGNPYSERGPPKTHPSAGISYLRTSSFMDNHPIYGPQKYHPMVKARVLKPRRDAMNMRDPIVGVAGFVLTPPIEQRNQGSAMMMLSKRGKALGSLDLEGKGGSTVYYRLESAEVNSKGKVCITATEPPNPTAELVAKELLGECTEDEKVYERSMEEDRKEEEQDWTQSTFGQFRQRRSHYYGSGSSYGLGLNRH